MPRVLFTSFFIVFLLFQCSVVHAFAQCAGIEELRAMYHKSYTDKAVAQKLYSITRIVEKDNSLQLGYKAVSGMMMCKYVFNPYTKMKYFWAGKSDLEQAIRSNPESVELRYLRYAVQCNVPDMLNYSSNKAEDKQVLQLYVATVANRQKDGDLYKHISRFLANSKDGRVD